MYCRIGLCDDNKFFLEKMERIITEYSNTYSHNIEIYSYETGEQLIESYETIFFNILILDVDLGEHLSGIEIAKKIREKDKEVVIIFITSYEDFALEAYQVSASQYLLKPVKYQNVEEVLNKTLKQIQINAMHEADEAKTMVIETVGGLEQILIDDILYIQKDGNRMIYHTYRNDYFTYDTIKELKKRLNPAEFAQINQGEFVNWSKVQDVVKERIILGDLELQISRAFQIPIRERFKSQVMGKALNRFLKHM